MAICPHCKEQIEDGTKKCPHCGLWVTRLRRFCVVARTTVEFITFITAIVVLLLMYHQNSIMKDSLKVSEKSLIQIDSSLALNAKQIDLMSKQLNVEVKAEDVQRKKVIEEKRPRVAISSHQVTISGTEMLIRTEVLNRGESDANNVIILIFYKLRPELKEKNSDYYTFPKIPKNSSQIIKNSIVVKADVGDFYTLVDVRYDWSLFLVNNLEEYKGYWHHYDKEKKTYITHNLDDKMIKDTFNMSLRSR